MSDMKETINKCIELARSRDMNTDFALSYEDRRGGGRLCWRAEIVNPCSAVALGESSGTYGADGYTPEEAVAALYQNMLADKRTR